MSHLREHVWFQEGDGGEGGDGVLRRSAGGFVLCAQVSHHHAVQPAAPRRTLPRCYRCTSAISMCHRIFRT